MFRLRWARLRAPLSASPVRTAGWDRLFQVLELVGVFDAYHWLSNACSPRLRGLTPRERQLLATVFGDSVPYDIIRIDERAHLGPRRHRLCYVGFWTINSWGAMTDPTLVHEVVHVWQYVHRGAAYIPRALAAQRSAAGYCYGGRTELLAGRGLDSFNYEQMAALVEDAFRLRNGYPARWLRKGSAVNSAIYSRYLVELCTHILPLAYGNPA